MGMETRFEDKGHGGIQVKAFALVYSLFLYPKLHTMYLIMCTARLLTLFSFALGYTVYIRSLVNHGGYCNGKMRVVLRIRGRHLSGYLYAVRW